MTSNGDIVERLRQNPSSELEQEAADEIERRRAALVIARKYARTDTDAASIAWAEGTITYMRRQLEQLAVQIQRDDGDRALAMAIDVLPIDLRAGREPHRTADQADE
jgi:hypothetical protein